MKYYKNEIIDQILFKLISLIDYNNNQLKNLNIIDLNFYININELNILNLNNYIDELYEYNHLILDDYKLFKEYKEILLQNNLDHKLQIQITNDIVFINLNIIENLFNEILEIISKKN